MERPGHKITRRDLFRSTKVCEMELKERASKSADQHHGRRRGASGGRRSSGAGGQRHRLLLPAPSKRVQGATPTYSSEAQPGIYGV
ncbi:hypothetical protein CEXT_664011 [Caerostris extrusa]|uniref:Uncharacterized protein n=1 Tax=Caerostris extrusa TaxID=172846 RepID=A0AAV4RRR1_CAEEX|nr:hypothetical protein CEXT_664011 [Caerostris extrusa]